MIHKDNAHPDGEYIAPDRRIFATVSPCKTRQMTEEERERYGEPNPVKRQSEAFIEKEFVYFITEKDKDFAEKVKTERARRGISRKEFGALCGVSATTIGGIENLFRIPKLKTKEKINKYFGWECDAIDDQ